MQAWREALQQHAHWTHLFNGTCASWSPNLTTNDLGEGKGWVNNMCTLLVGQDYCVRFSKDPHVLIFREEWTPEQGSSHVSALVAHNTPCIHQGRVYPCSNNSMYHNSHCCVITAYCFPMLKHRVVGRWEGKIYPPIYFLSHCSSKL